MSAVLLAVEREDAQLVATALRIDATGWEDRRPELPVMRERFRQYAATLRAYAAALAEAAGTHTEGD